MKQTNNCRAYLSQVKEIAESLSFGEKMSLRVLGDYRYVYLGGRGSSRGIGSDSVARALESKDLWYWNKDHYEPTKLGDSVIRFLEKEKDMTSMEEALGVDTKTELFNKIEEFHSLLAKHLEKVMVKEVEEHAIEMALALGEGDGEVFTTEIIQLSEALKKTGEVLYLMDVYRVQGS